MDKKCTSNTFDFTTFGISPLLQHYIPGRLPILRGKRMQFNIIFSLRARVCRECGLYVYGMAIVERWSPFRITLPYAIWLIGAPLWFIKTGIPLAVLSSGFTRPCLSKNNREQPLLIAYVANKETKSIYIKIVRGPYNIKCFVKGDLQISRFCGITFSRLFLICQ